MTTVIIIVVVIVVIAAVAGMAMAARRRRLQQRFGPEYDRAVEEKDSRMQAEAELTERQRRVRKYNIRPLTPEARSTYMAQWQRIQEQFVDSPQTAVTEAYSLVLTVMRERGYPIDDEEQVADDLSVEHASTIDHFRSAQTVTREAVHGSVATEDMRQALINYRELFADLLGSPADVEAPRTSVPRHAMTDADAVDPGNGEAVPARTLPVDTDPDGVPVTTPYREPDGSPRQ
jgi:FtsZ-interacting cell division protein ZipA